MSITIRSDAFADGRAIPQRHGEDVMLTSH
jgi:hypothetical protein